MTDVLVERVYCPACGSEARWWKTPRGVVRLPTLIPMDEVRNELNNAWVKKQHDCGTPLFAEMSAARDLS